MIERKKIIALFLCLTTLFIFGGCGKSKVKSNIVGDWVVASLDIDKNNDLATAGADVYQVGSEIRITEEGRYVILGQSSKYELLENSYIEITDATGGVANCKYELVDNTLTIHFLGDALIVHFNRK